MRTIMRKKLLFTLAAVVLCGSAAFGQAQEEQSRRGGSGRSEIRFGYGMLSANSLVDSYSDLIPDFEHGGVAYADESTSGAFYLSYRYRILPRVMFGATLGYERVRKNYVFTAGSGSLENVGGKNDYLTVAADLQFRYLQVPSGILSLYWGVGLGAGFHRQKLTDFDYGPAKNDKTRLAYQVTPLGMTLGLKRFGAFAEVGFGYRGVFQFGAYFRF